MNKQATLFDAQRALMGDAMKLTVQSLTNYGARYPHWAIAYSGGKDSTALVTMVLALLDQGAIPAPQSLTVLYADTRMELPPLHQGALATLQVVRDRGFQALRVLPALDARYLVYMLGRGVNPPKNRFRWCTPQLKVEPMLMAMAALREETGHKILMLTGVRMGESVMRDQRIALSCSRDGSECGQGWFQTAKSEAIADTLAPLLHWRVCHIWDWLMHYGRKICPSVALVAQVYGDDEAEEINARTGCIGCPLASRDTALDALLRHAEWAYLAPLKRLRPLYTGLWSAPRKQKVGERKKDGQYTANPGRKGPLTLATRRRALSDILAIQSAVNLSAAQQARPPIDLLNPEELARIHALLGERTYPQRWSDADPDASPYLPQYYPGTIQFSLFSAEETSW